MQNAQKTVFISLSSSPVFRNLFLFPGSVFDRCKRLIRERVGICFVFLVPEEQFAKYRHLFEGVDDTNFLVEAVSAPPRDRLFGRAFRFLYAYLIYTDTTKLLATMGMRPDEMAPGSRYLAPVKALIAATLGRSPWFTRRAVPRLFNLFFPHRPFARVFEKYRPDAVFAPNLYGWFDTLLIREARDCGAKSIGMTANWDHIDKYFIPFRADRFLAQNEDIGRKAAALQGYPPGAIAVVGYPHFDFIVNREYAMRREDLLASMGVPPDARFLLYISGSVYAPDEPEVLTEIARWIEDGKFGKNMYLALRPYIGGRFRDREFDEEKFSSLRRRPKVFVYERQSWAEIEGTARLLGLMRHADIVISAFSTAALEAALFDRPLIAVGFDGHRTRPLHRSVRRFERFGHFQEVFATGAIRIVRSFDDLSAAISAYLENPSLDRERREALRRSMCGPLDGRVSERILDFIVRG